MDAKLVFKSKRELLTDKFKVNLFSVSGFSLQKSDFLCRLYVSFLIFKHEIVYSTRNQDKTGHADTKYTNAVVWVVLQKFFSKNENLL